MGLLPSRIVSACFPFYSKADTRMIKDFRNLNLLKPHVVSWVVSITFQLWTVLSDWGLPESTDGPNQISKLLLSCHFEKKRWCTSLFLLLNVSVMTFLASGLHTSPGIHMFSHYCACRKLWTSAIQSYIPLARSNFAHS